MRIFYVRSATYICTFNKAHVAFLLLFRFIFCLFYCQFVVARSYYAADLPVCRKSGVNCFPSLAHLQNMRIGPMRHRHGRNSDFTGIGGSGAVSVLVTAAHIYIYKWKLETTSE